MTGASTPVISLSIHLGSEPAAVWDALTTSSGRERYWAEQAPEQEGVIHFQFSNGQALDSPILKREAPRLLVIRYFGNSTATFRLAPADGGGTLLRVEEIGVPEPEWAEQRAGWVSLLLALKAAVDFGIDLRNSNPAWGWEEGFVDV